jgi:hypothetical protein
MIDLQEVKKAILMYPGIKDALIDFENNTLSAGIIIDTDNDITDEYIKIKQFLSKMIAAYKIPKFINRI